MEDERVCGLPEIEVIVREGFGVYQSLTRAIEQLTTSTGQMIGQERKQEVRLLKSIPGVGKIGAYTLMSSIDQVSRFQNAKQLAAYSGLVPSTHNSGESEKLGRITKEGRSEIRRVLVQGAHALLRSSQVESVPLKEWYYSIEKRRGKQKALVALARRLVCLSYHVLKNRRAYDPRLLKQAA